MVKGTRLIGAAAVCAIALAAGGASAATLSFSLTDTRGSDSTDTDVVLMDVAGGVKMSFTVNDPSNFSDLAAVYFDVLSPFDATTITGITGPAGTVTGTDTSGNVTNVQAGKITQGNNPGFDVGVAIGSTGSGGGEFFDDFMFTVLAPNLDVTDFFGQNFAVRGQTVGPIRGTGGGSSKEWGVAGTVVDQTPNVVPLPAAGWMLLAGLGGLGAMSRFRKS